MWRTTAGGKALGSRPSLYQRLDLEGKLYKQDRDISKNDSKVKIFSETEIRQKDEGC